MASYFSVSNKFSIQSYTQRVNQPTEKMSVILATRSQREWKRSWLWPSHANRGTKDLTPVGKLWILPVLHWYLLLASVCFWRTTEGEVNQNQTGKPQGMDDKTHKLEDCLEGRSLWPFCHDHGKIWLEEHRAWRKNSRLQPLSCLNILIQTKIWMGKIAHRSHPHCMVAKSGCLHQTLYNFFWSDGQRRHQLLWLMQPRRSSCTGEFFLLHPYTPHQSWRKES